MVNIVGYYSNYSYHVISVDGKQDGLPVTDFISYEEALEYYSESNH